MPKATKPKKQKAARHRERADAAAKAVGLRVKELRKSLSSKGSFDLVVEESGLGRGYLSELERGLVVPGLHALMALARAFDVTVADLVVDDDLRGQLYTTARRLSEPELQNLLAVAQRMADAAARSTTD